MLIARTRADLHTAIQIWKAKGQKIAFVPTMGALHEGHISLMTLAGTKADKVVASIFVNPTQFAPHEDFAQYPRHEAEDCAKLEAARVDLVYLPTEGEIYQDGRAARLQPGPAALGLESDFRPHFFGGVVNVVDRLFQHVTPDIAIFGEKDYQQLQVIREIAADIEIIGGPIVRDAEGLALSSRNAYLSPEELAIARTLNKVLKTTSLRTNGEAIQSGKDALLKTGFNKIDYLETRWNRLLVAVWLGRTRLIDNIPLP